MVGLPSITDPGLGNPDLAFWQTDLTHVSLGIRSDTDRVDRGLFFRPAVSFTVLAIRQTGQDSADIRMMSDTFS